VNEGVLRVLVKMGMGLVGIKSCSYRGLTGDNAAMSEGTYPLTQEGGSIGCKKGSLVLRRYAL